MAREKAKPSERYLVVRNQEVWDEFDTLSIAQEYAETIDDLDPIYDEVVIAKVVSVAELSGIKWR